VGSIKFIRVPGEHSAFIKKKRNKKNDSKQNEMEDKKKKMETKIKGTLRLVACGDVSP
jgi:hypothetical protein